VTFYDGGTESCALDASLAYFRAHYSSSLEKITTSSRGYRHIITWRIATAHDPANGHQIVHHLASRALYRPVLHSTVLY